MKPNNFKDIFTVTKFTMQDMISRKSFRISTIIILVLIIIGFNLPGIITNITGGDFTDTILISDPDNLYDGKLNTLEDSDLGYHFDITPINYDDIKTKIDNGDISSAIIINKQDDSIKLNYLVNNAATANIPNQLINALTSLYTNIQISKLNLSPTQLASVTPTFDFQIMQTGEQEISGNIGVAMIVSILLFFAIYFCALQVSSSITVEKTSKIMETLVTSTSPRTIILGKTIGIGLVGLGQILLFVVTAVICANISLDHAVLEQLFNLNGFTPLLIIITLAYFILGYFAYALLYALVGSTVSKPEDIQSANTPVAIITMIGFYLAYFTLTDPTSNLNVVAALLPISSPFCMPIRIMMGAASGWEVTISIIILLAFCYIVAKIAIKIYSSAILNYGTRMTISDMIKTYKEK